MNARPLTLDQRATLRRLAEYDDGVAVRQSQHTFTVKQLADMGYVLRYPTHVHVTADGRRALDHRPINRAEALSEIIVTGFTISAMFALARVFPFPGERDECDRFLNRLAETDPSFATHLRQEIERYVAAWSPPPPAPVGSSHCGRCGSLIVGPIAKDPKTDVPMHPHCAEPS